MKNPRCKGALFVKNFWKWKQRTWYIWGVNSDTRRKEYQTSCLEGSWRNRSSWSVSLPACYALLLCPPFTLIVPNVTFFHFICSTSSLCFNGQVFHLGKGGKASYCIFIKHTCDFSLKLLEFFAFLQTFSFPHLHFVPPQCWGATNCTCVEEA